LELLDPTSIYLTIELFRDFGLVSRHLSSTNLMFARVNQVTRHLSRPTLRTGGQLLTSRSTMAAPGGKKQIHTAGIIIIGDEVLGGKVSHIAYANHRLQHY
jgi:hypothetical protein